MKKAQKQKRGRLWGGGEGCVGSCWEALARDHVILLGARVSRQNGQADEAFTLGHSATLWDVGNPRNRPFLAALFSGRRCGRDLGWVRTKVRAIYIYRYRQSYTCSQPAPPAHLRPPPLTLSTDVVILRAPPPSRLSLSPYIYI